MLGGEQALLQPLDHRPLADQRVRQQRLARGDRVARDRRLRRQPLVRRHVLDEPQELRRQRRLRQWLDSVRADPRRHLDDVVIGQSSERPVVADVDLVHLAAAGDERRHEPGGGLAVERAAALLEQRRLLGEAGVAIHVEQLALDLGHARRPRLSSVELLAEHLVVPVEVVQVVGRDGAQLVEHAPRAARMLGVGIAVLRHQLGEDVAAVPQDPADPRQVVEPDLVDDDPLRLDAEQARGRPLKADRDVAETDGTMAGVEKRARDDSDRVREVDDPRVRRGELPYALGDLEHHRHRSHRLREAARTGRLLPDAPARERHGLVGEPRRLAAHADLHEDEVGAVDRAVEVSGDRQVAREPLLREHARSHRADDVAPLLVDVVEDELADVDALALAREPRDELRRVRRTGADDRELHPLTPVSVTPSTNALWARKKRMMTGAITSRVAAMVNGHCTWCSERNSDRPIDSTQWFEVSPTYRSGRKKSLNV